MICGVDGVDEEEDEEVVVLMVASSALFGVVVRWSQTLKHRSGKML